MDSCHSSPQDCGKRIIGWGQWGLCSEFKVNLSFIESPCLIKQTAEVFKNWNVKPWIFDVFIIQNYLDNHAVEKNPLNKMQKTLTTKTMMNKLDKLKARVGTGELAQWLRACAALAFTWLLPTLVPLRALHAVQPANAPLTKDWSTSHQDGGAWIGISENFQRAKKYVKICSATLVIRKTQIKIIMG